MLVPGPGVAHAALVTRPWVGCGSAIQAASPGASRAPRPGWAVPPEIWAALRAPKWVAEMVGRSPWWVKLPALCILCNQARSGCPRWVGNHCARCASKWWEWYNGRPNSINATKVWVVMVGPHAVLGGGQLRASGGSTLCMPVVALARLMLARHMQLLRILVLIELQRMLLLMELLWSMQL